MPVPRVLMASPLARYVRLWACCALIRVHAGAVTHTSFRRTYILRHRNFIHKQAAGEDERVGSIGGKGGRPDSAIPGAGWTQNDFDDSAWEAPTKATCQ